MSCNIGRVWKRYEITSTVAIGSFSLKMGSLEDLGGGILAWSEMIKKIDFNRQNGPMREWEELGQSAIFTPVAQDQGFSLYCEVDQRK
jgi:hypothetical protein